jgi:predicted helicase
MPELRLGDKHKSVLSYYQSLRQYSLLEATHEGAVKAAFGTLLAQCAKQFEWTVVGEYELPRHKQRSLRVDGALVDRWKLARGYWEAKDEYDDLAVEAKKKIALGYPTTNTIFQSPERAILYQNGRRVRETSLVEPSALIGLLKDFFGYEPPAFAEWERAVDDFGDEVPKLAAALLGLIKKERQENKRFTGAFGKFLEVCRASINPNLTEVAVEKMLVQHILTERIFRKVFDNPDFARRNVIAIEIERVVDALTSRAFDRKKFLGDLDRFYVAIEKTAATIDDYTEKQHFLNSIYERFFQSFDAKTADTHGIVYTPQSIVRFMVRSVDEVLEKEFGRSLGDRNVHVIDPFVGTGNFLVHVIRQIPRTRLEYKYAGELHANEVMLLPYYVASMNIEHEYAEITGAYKPFDGMCLVDTFELAEPKQQTLSFMSEVNSERVARQKRSPIFVVLGNPPYNAWQLDENDNNRNRRYPALDERVGDTYGQDSTATLKNSLSDPYIKAFRWASDRIGEEGVVAFVTNNAFVDGLACDGVRKHLARDFDALYLLDLGGNVRKNPKLSGTVHNVFGIKVGVTIGFFVRRKATAGMSRQATLYQWRAGEYWRREEKYRFLDEAVSIGGVEWKTLAPSKDHTWITDGLRDEYSTLVPLVAHRVSGSNEPESVFASSSNGVQSNNDAYVYGFDFDKTRTRARAMVAEYNTELAKSAVASAKGMRHEPAVDERLLKWVRKSKRYLARGERASFEEKRIVRAAYRPFAAQWLFFDPMFNEDLYRLPATYTKNPNTISIVVSDAGSEKPFMSLAVSGVPDRHLVGAGSTARVLPRETATGDNITNWALSKYREMYSDERISKTDIFNYVYGVLHSTEYRARYAANLKRELPRIPFTRDFWAFANAGSALVRLHTECEKQSEFPLRRVETPGEQLNWKVAKMRVSKDQAGILYNDFLTLVGVPREVFEYKLGNRSALEWVVDQYQVSTDRRSGITNDPNRPDDPQYIVRLIGQVVSVSLETMKIVKTLPSIDGNVSLEVRGSSPPSEGRGPAKAKPRVREPVVAKARSLKDSSKSMRKIR